MEIDGLLQIWKMFKQKTLKQDLIFFVNIWNWNRRLPAVYQTFPYQLRYKAFFLIKATNFIF